MRDYLGYLLYTKALRLVSFLGGVAIFILKAIEVAGEAGPLKLPSNLLNIGISAATIFFFTPWGAAGELANFIHERRAKRAAETGLLDQVNRSIYLHARLINGVDSKSDEAMCAPLAKRKSDERRAIFDSLRLIESVLRERVRLHKHTDIRTSLLVKRQSDICYMCMEVGEEIEDNFEHELDD